MTVDRGLLPPLPGKPEWYVENAPFAVDPRVAAAGAVTVLQQDAQLSALPAQPEPGLLPAASALAAPSFPTVTVQPDRGKSLRRVRALAGKLRT